LRWFKGVRTVRTIRGIMLFFGDVGADGRGTVIHRGGVRGNIFVLPWLMCWLSAGCYFFDIKGVAGYVSHFTF